MTVEELEALLHKHGWYLAIVRKWRKDYAYAKRRVGRKGQSKYIKAMHLLGELTPEFVLKRIQ